MPLTCPRTPIAKVKTEMAPFHLNAVCCFWNYHPVKVTAGKLTR